MTCKLLGQIVHKLKGKQHTHTQTHTHTSRRSHKLTFFLFTKESSLPKMARRWERMKTYARIREFWLYRKLFHERWYLDQLSEYD